MAAICKPRKLLVPRYHCNFVMLLVDPFLLKQGCHGDCCMQHMHANTVVMGCYEHLVNRGS